MKSTMILQNHWYYTCPKLFLAPIVLNSTLEPWAKLLQTRNPCTSINSKPTCFKMTVKIKYVSRANHVPLACKIMMHGKVTCSVKYENPWLAYICLKFQIVINLRTKIRDDLAEKLTPELNLLRKRRTDGKTRQHFNVSYIHSGGKQMCSMIAKNQQSYILRP